MYYLWANNHELIIIVIVLEEYMKKAGWQNWINLILGVALFTVPWLTPHNLPADKVELVNWNFWILGAVVVISASSALRDLQPWEEWANLFVAFWLIVSPWIIGFVEESNLMLNSILLGLTIGVLSAMALPVAQRLQHPQH